MKIEGAEQTIKALASLGITKARNVIRASVRAQAADARDRVRANAPVHPVDVVKRNKTGNFQVTKKGTLKKAIISKDRKPKGDKFQTNVRITEGKGVKNDAYYWKFLEYGTVYDPDGKPFIKPVEDEKKATAESDMQREFENKVVAAINKAIR